MSRHSPWRVDAKPAATIHGREAGLVGTVQGRRSGIHMLVFGGIGIVGWQGGEGCSGSSRIHGHGRLGSGGRHG